MPTSKNKPGLGGSGAKTEATSGGVATPRVSTVFEDSGRSTPPVEVTEGQRRKRMLDNLIAIAASEVDGEWARTLCRTVAKFAADDRELASIVTALIRDGRKGKPRGNVPWPRWRYWYLLEHYYGFRSIGDTSKQAAAKVAITLSCSVAEIMKKRLPRANTLAKSLIEEFAGGAGQERRRRAIEQALETHRKKLPGG